MLLLYTTSIAFMIFAVHGRHEYNAGVAGSHSTTGVIEMFLCAEGETKA